MRFPFRFRRPQALTAPSAPRAPRPRRLAVEQLEAREVPSAVSFSFTLDESSASFGLTTTQRSQLVSGLQAAGQLWSDSLEGAGAAPTTLEVRVVPGTLAAGVLATGGPATTVLNASSIAEPGTLYEGRTGVDPNGTTADITLTLSTSYVQTGAYYDPSGAARTGTVPSSQIDFISVAAHELGHGLGFLSSRNSTGAIPSGYYPTTYDALTTGSGTSLYFAGSRAEAAYGGPVPLSVGSYSHIGNGSTLSGDLMYPSVNYGVKESISALDVAILADQGWAVPPPDLQVDTGTVAGTTLTLTERGNVYRQVSGGSPVLVATGITQLDSGSGQFFVADKSGNVFLYNTGTAALTAVASGVAKIGSGAGQFFVQSGTVVFRYNSGTFNSVASGVTDIGSGAGQFFVQSGTVVYRYNSGTFTSVASGVTKIGSGQGQFFVQSGTVAYRYDSGTFTSVASGVTDIGSGQGQFFVQSGTVLYRYNSGTFTSVASGVSGIGSGQGQFFVLTGTAVFRYSLNSGSTFSQSIPSGIAQIWSSLGQLYVRDASSNVFRFVLGVGYVPA